MLSCVVCGSLEFYTEAGYFYCQECQTQSQEKREEILEIRVDPSTRLRKTRIRQDQSTKSAQEIGWTSWELYNFILIGLTNELIELGAPMEIKLTVLQLWSTYLGKIEVAFTSTEKQHIPKLARRFNKKDAAIIYGKIQQKKRNRKRKRDASGASASSLVSTSYMSEGSSIKELNKQKKMLVAAEYDRYIQSQDSSEADAVSLMNQSLYSLQSNGSRSSTRSKRVQFSKHAKMEAKRIKEATKILPLAERRKLQEKYTRKQYLTSPNMVSPVKLWAILYLALRIHDQQIHLGDMLRFVREGHLSYYKMDHLIPPEIVLTKSDLNIITQTTEITHKAMRNTSARMAKFLGVREITCPYFLPLISRYCQELQLPRGVLLYTERLIALAPPKMVFTLQNTMIPNYEARAMAFIIVILKLLFGLDGITEYEISRFAETTNQMVAESGRLDSTLFSFREWQRYIECRKALLTKLHFPTKLKYEQDLPSTSHLYLGFLKWMQSKKERDDTEEPKPKVAMPQELSNAMSQCIGKLNENSLPLNAGETFAPSLTPQYSYLEQLLENSDRDIPNLLRSNFAETKIAYTTKPEMVKKLIFGDHVNLEVIDSNMHFLEKLVPPFKQVVFSLKELNQFVLVGTDDSKENFPLRTGDDLTEYLYRNNIGKLKMDMKKQSLYDSVQNLLPTTQDLTSECWEDFAFNEILPNGRLLIDDDNDVGSHDDETFKTNNSSSQDNIDNFYDNYNLEFSSTEKEAILNAPISKNPVHNPIIMYFDSLGNFVKSKYRNHEGIKAKVFEMPLVEQQKCNTDDLHSKTTAINIIAKKKKKKAKVKDPNNPFNLSDDEISTLNGCIGENENENCSLKTEITDNLKLFRPYSEYWIYHCELDVGQPTFELFEKELPTSFRWLLNECASVIEVTTENLYNEICLIESYHGHILNPSYLRENNIYAAKNCKRKSHYNSLKRRW
ncbi:TATA box-binding protein-associated factor RNA polymerase I subunit B [Cephus cinctus]|uniref:TATA box-binding protein-associated factor RNA polymerase I subunit B n=1 Tax=Cephus cinctus TaxID=211228 RepID=A0AAJ7FL57_CEPCN|nr:TATA box-binding protein-associated factor RNA polymerase I subunit B [Cephus cinctus]XP_024941749.1 TATA box-binding protein-associated factor RNA polymerase I subunit B [Cephus cinctus]